MEQVWEYPRPPKLEPCARRVRIEIGRILVADSTRALRVLETSHPPTIYIPRADFAAGVLREAGGPSTLCEFKGRTAYLDVAGRPRAAWYYPAPVERYAALLDHVAFYPSRMDRCLLDEEVVQAQDGDFYGGWITSDLVGPFKGGPGTLGW